MDPDSGPGGPGTVNLPKNEHLANPKTQKTEKEIIQNVVKFVLVVFKIIKLFL
jgi:hypothetical protein